MKLYLIASSKLDPGLDRFLADRNLKWYREEPGTESEMLAEFAGRVCYMSFGDLQYRRSTRTYLENILKAEHESVLEHASFTVLIDGISRSLSHQLVRHRAGFAYSQLSQQYHDESGVDFLKPNGIEKDPELLSRWNTWRQETLALYAELSDADFSVESISPKEKSRYHRSMARLVLPNAAATTLVVTGNARAWRHVFKVRGDILGDIEMRTYCAEVFKLLSAEAPEFFMDFHLVEDGFGCYVEKFK